MFKALKSIGQAQLKINFAIAGEGNSKPYPNLSLDYVFILFGYTTKIMGKIGQWAYEGVPMTHGTTLDNFSVTCISFPIFPRNPFWAPTQKVKDLVTHFDCKVGGMSVRLFISLF